MAFANRIRLSNVAPTVWEPTEGRAVFLEDLDAALWALGMRAGWVQRVAVLLLKPGVQAVALYRAASWLRRQRIPLLADIITLVAVALTGCEIAPGACIGAGLIVHHSVGNVVHPQVRAGVRLHLYGAVTLGTTGLPAGLDAPQIGDFVNLGAGAKVLGGVTVGDRVFVGANAVVVQDIPADHRAVGNPAKATKRRW